jgi:hypothetical protein
MNARRIPRGVRVLVQGAQERLVEAAKVLRAGGCPETADDLIRESRRVGAYAAPGGLFDLLDAGGPPEARAAFDRMEREGQL